MDGSGESVMPIASRRELSSAAAGDRVSVTCHKAARGERWEGERGEMSASDGDDWVTHEGAGGVAETEVVTGIDLTTTHARRKSNRWARVRGLPWQLRESVPCPESAGQHPQRPRYELASAVGEASQYC